MYDEGAVPVVVRNGVPDTVFAATLTPVLYLSLDTTISKVSRCLERNRDSDAWCGWSSHLHRLTRIPFLARLTCPRQLVQ
jgi:hypothetical protein